MKKKLSLFDKKTRSLPEVGEFVLGTVTQIFPYGVFVKLDEYDIVGMVHIKEVSTGWVKNIRNYVKERQKVVTKVLKMDPSRRYIDLSLKRVTQKQAKLRKQQYRTERRVEKLLQYYSEDKGIPWNDVLERIVKPIEDKFEDMFYGFEEIVKNKSLLENLVPKEYQESFYNLLKKNIEIPHVELSGFLEISCFEKNGVEV
ncbi:MAG: S1 RNA-binding domain-containing protein, partial [Candidatus Methanofastidiosia archaeon]